MNLITRIPRIIRIFIALFFVLAFAYLLLFSRQPTSTYIPPPPVPPTSPSPKPMELPPSTPALPTPPISIPGIPTPPGSNTG